MEEVQYEVTEGGVVEICVLSEGELDSTFTALVQSNDLTAQGQYTTPKYKNNGSHSIRAIDHALGISLYLVYVTTCIYCSIMNMPI